jgi:hypothetical protein
MLFSISVEKMTGDLDLICFYVLKVFLKKFNFIYLN